jgi:hypothetical protein
MTVHISTVQKYLNTKKNIAFVHISTLDDIQIYSNLKGFIINGGSYGLLLETGEFDGL